MTNSICIIPVYFRPELLYFCLEKLAACPEIKSKDIWIFQDQHAGDELRLTEHQWIQDAIAPWRFKMNIRFVKRPEWPYKTFGNTANTMEAYKEAYATNAKYVYLVEEDVLVTPDFFRWHEAVQNAGDYFCTIPWRHPGNVNILGKDNADYSVTDPCAYFESAWTYASIGVGWKRENLASIIKHATPEYYQNCMKYVYKHFPSKQFGIFGEEQDGLIVRILGTIPSKTIAWSYVPRCYHMGWFGYHRGTERIPGQLSEKIAAMREAITNPSVLKMRVGKSWGGGDITAYPTTFPAWDGTVYCRQKFTGRKGQL